MVPLFAVDWATISALATAAGTLVLAIATFAAVCSSNRAARVAEAALQEQRRPILAQSRLQDPTQKIMFLEGHWVHASGGHAAVEHLDGIVYLAISLRNVGSGIAVCQGWSVRPGSGSLGELPTHTPVENFRLQSRDLYIPAADMGMWQGALRNPDDQMRAHVADAIDARQPITVELLYSDQIGGQRTISRFGLYAAGDSWLATLNRHWYLDWQGPRPDNLTLEAVQTILSDQRAAAERRPGPPEDAAAAGPGGSQDAEAYRADSAGT
jgi:hypothetical protein